MQIVLALTIPEVATVYKLHATKMAAGEAVGGCSRKRFSRVERGADLSASSEAYLEVCREHFCRSCVAGSPEVLDQSGVSKKLVFDVLCVGVWGISNWCAGVLCSKTTQQCPIRQWLYVFTCFLSWCSCQMSNIVALPVGVAVME